MSTLEQKALQKPLLLAFTNDAIDGVSLQVKHLDANRSRYTTVCVCFINRDTGCLVALSQVRFFKGDSAIDIGDFEKVRRRFAVLLPSES